MASAFNKEVRRSITGSIGRFIAIAVIAALGCGFYAGLRMTPIDMDISADAFYDGTNLSDVYVAGTLGFEDEDVGELKAIEGVKGIEPVRMVDAYAMLGGSKYVVRFNSLDVASARASDCSGGEQAKIDNVNYINRPVLVEGTWPQAPGECVIASDAVLDEPVKVGDTIEIVGMDGDLGDTFARTSYVITGLVRSPYYVMTSNFGPSDLGSGKIETYAYVFEEDFAEDFPYTGVFIVADGAAEQAYPGAGYDNAVNPVIERINSKDFDLRSKRLAGVKASAQKELDDARATYDSEYAKAMNELGSAEGKLASSKVELADAKDELDSNKQKLKDAKSELEAGSAKLEKTAKLLEQKQADLDAGKEQYQAGVARLAAARAEAAQKFAAQQAQIDKIADPVAKKAAQAQLDQAKAAAKAQFDETQKTLDASKAQLDAGQKELDAGKQQYKDGVKEIEAGYEEYEAGRTKLQDGYGQYKDGVAQYDKGLAQFKSSKAEALSKLADAKTELDEAQADIDDIELPDLYVLDRSKNVGVSGRKSDAERIDQIAQVFPFIFFLVAALVSLTTMTRMVDEERMLIGTFKALGYGNARISSKYLIYALIASGVGSIIGIIVLSQFLPQFIMNAYSIIYSVPVALSPIDIPLALLAAGLAVGITVGATLLAVLSTLRERPALLMLPRAPKPGKRILLERIGFLWKRMSFTSKVTARNLFRYKRRFFMATIGIAGCTALLLTGLGLHDGINDIIDKQFGQIQQFNLDVQCSEEQSEGDAQKVKELLNDAGFVTGTTQVFSQNAIASVAGSNQDIYSGIIVPSNADEFKNFYNLRERVSQDPLSLDDSGVIITEKLATELGVKAGDSIELYEQSKVGDRSGAAHTARVSGVAEFYTGQRIFMTKSYYQQLMGESCIFSVTLCKASAPFEQRTVLANKLLDVPGVEVVSYYDEVIDTYRTMLETVNAVVIILIVAAALLAFVVLYNLTNINISERTREIATLKVLGFTPHETNAYIYRETILLTIIGALFGCVLGIWMEGFVVVTAEVDQMMFGREIHFVSFVLAFVLTLAFSIIVTLAMKPKLKSINMVESLKSVD